MKIKEAGMEEQQAQEAAELTPEQLAEQAEHQRLLVAIKAEDMGTGSYLSCIIDREVLVRALRKAQPDVYPVWMPQVPPVGA